MYFKSRHKHKKKNKGGGKCINTSGCLKQKKRFGLTPEEMTSLVSGLIEKPKIPIVQIV
jgi:hypothetical protein